MSMTPAKLSLTFSRAPYAKGHGRLTESNGVAVLAKIEISSNLEHLAKWELEPPFVFISQGARPSCWTLGSQTCDFRRICN